MVDTSKGDERSMEWGNFYNYNRAYAAMEGKTPYERLKEKLKLCV